MPLTSPPLDKSAFAGVVMLVRKTHHKTKRHLIPHT